MSPTMLPPTMRVGDEEMQVKAPPQRKQPHVVACQASSSGSSAWRREAPPTRTLIQEEDAASLTRLRTPQGFPTKMQEMRIATLVQVSLLACARRRRFEVCQQRSRISVLGLDASRFLCRRRKMIHQGRWTANNGGVRSVRTFGEEQM